MPADTRVIRITVQPPVYARCPSQVVVTLDNNGSDAPVTTTLDRSFEVCLESPDFLAEGGRYRRRVVLQETDLRPGTRLDVTFDNVQFRNPGTSAVTATADCTLPRQIANNQPTQPTFSDQVSGIGTAAWLWAEGVLVGLRYGSSVLWNPTALCPGGDFVVEARISNRGSDVAVASQARVVLNYGTGNQITTTASQGPIAAGGTGRVTWWGIVPNAPGNQLTAQVCADDATRVAPQCDRNHLCAQSSPLPITQTAVPPGLFLEANGAGSAIGTLKPGENLVLRWRIINTCANLGSITAKVLFSGSSLYTSAAIPMVLQDEHEETVTLNSGQVSAGLYQLGVHNLVLEITGTGQDPGPYQFTSQVEVKPPFVDWVWSSPFANPSVSPNAFAFLNEARTMSGILDSFAPVSLTVVSVTLNETDTSLAPLPPRSISTPPVGPLPPFTPSSRSLTTVTWPGVRNTWTWLTPGTWLNSGPTSRTFRYSVTYVLSDAFGNTYPAVTSALTVTVLVRVPFGKESARAAAVANQAIAYAYLAAAAAALASIGGAFLVPGLLAAAAQFQLLASGFGQIALDPPLPDFDYFEVVEVTPPALPETLVASPELAATRAVLELVGRAQAARQALTRIHGKLLAARIDRNEEAIQLQSEAYLQAERLLLESAAVLPETANQAAQTTESGDLLPAWFERQALERQLETWQSEGLSDELRQLWREAGLPAETLAELERLAREITFPEGSSSDWLRQLAGDLERFARAVEEESAAILGG